MTQATPLQLIELRLKQAGLKKRKLAEHLGVTPQYLSMIFSGIRPLPAHIEASAFNFLGIIKQ